MKIKTTWLKVNLLRGNFSKKDKSKIIEILIKLNLKTVGTRNINNKSPNWYLSEIISK